MKDRKRGILEEIFNIDPPRESWLFDSPKKKDQSKRSGKRPWQSDKEECPNCGTMFPVGKTCPGCGLHDEEMPWGR